jgi:Domain of unknown function (DUF222)
MSSSTGLEQRPHPIVGFAGRLHAVLDTLVEVPAWSMTRGEQRYALTELARAEGRLAELRLRVLAAADRSDLAADTAATSTGAWLAQATRQTRAAAHADVLLAQALDGPFAATRDALADGLVDVDQARVIIRAIQALPDTVDGHDRGRAEKHLIDLAGQHDAKTLRLLGRRVFEVLDPDAADEQEGRKLQAEEDAAARKTYLHMCDNGDGTHTGRFKIPTLHAAMLTKMLSGFTNPRHRTSTGTGTNTAGTDGAEVPVVLTRPELLGQAFCELLERYPADRLPKAGGTSATVTVLLEFDKLTSGLGAAHLDTGQPLSAASARRLACEAGIVPVVYRKALAGPSVILDVGRQTRLHTEPQRTALAVRDQGCTATGCDRPPGWCHAHHDTPWAAGGPTSIDNGRLLCPFHHRKAHSPNYDMTRHPNGQVSFHRRT